MYITSKIFKIKKLKILVIFFLTTLCSVLSYDISSKFFTNKVFNFSSGWSTIRYIHLSPPLVVQLPDHKLVHVLDSQESIRLTSLDFKACDVPLNLTYASRHPRQAVALGNDKIVVWLLSYSYLKSNHEGEWRFIIVDPKKCEYTGLDIPDKEPNPIDVIDVVGYEKSFDVFIMRLGKDELREINVFRYGDDGKPVPDFINNVIPDLDFYPFYRPNSIKFYSLKKHDSSSGYFYVQAKPDTNLTVIRRLSANFEIMKSTTLRKSKYYELSYSTHHGKFGICRYYKPKERRSLYCQLLNQDLKLKIKVHIRYESHKNFSKISHIDLYNMADGGALVLFALKADYHVGVPLYLQRIKPNGQVTKAEVFGKIKCVLYETEIFEMNSGAFCVTVTCDEIIHTRCIEIEGD